MTKNKVYKLIFEKQSKEYDTKETDNGQLFIEGIFGVADEKNLNERIYPRPIMEKALVNYNSNFVRNNRGLGELDHPESVTVNLDRVCLLASSDFSINQSGEIHGKAKILREQPLGKIAYNLIKEGVKLGISSRGLGDVEEIKNKDNIFYKVNDYELIAWDLVHEPSINRFVEGIVESRNFVKQNDIYEEIIHNNNSKEIDILSVDELIKIFNYILNK
jgi:hypothetical protein